MKRKGTILFALLLATAPSFPCGNSYHRSANADEYVHGSRMESFRFKRAFSNSALMAELTSLTDAINTQLDLFENENDRALTYMRMGRYDEATTILEKLEKEKPGEYNVIANLGTLYELKGENEKALQYIRKAVAINAQSHRGSEWFHIKILEAKLLHKNADWWKTHHVLDIAAVQKSPELIISDIVYQLKERLPFTQSPDVLMAAVLNETGDYLLEQNKNEQAWIIFKIATEYDSDNLFSLQTKIAVLEKKLTAGNKPLPDYNAHFVNADELIKTGTDLLEKGIGMYNRYQDREKEKAVAESRKRKIYFFAVGGLIIGLGVLLYFSLRKKNVA
jgi:tetratricopeptide (TPR) repeat protein